MVVVAAVAVVVVVEILLFVAVVAAAATAWGVVDTNSLCKGWSGFAGSNGWSDAQIAIAGNCSHAISVGCFIDFSSSSQQQNNHELPQLFPDLISSDEIVSGRDSGSEGGGEGVRDSSSIVSPGEMVERLVWIERSSAERVACLYVRKETER